VTPAEVAPKIITSAESGVSLLWIGRGERQGMTKTRKRRDHLQRDKEESMKANS
jgi:hypothetical protein